MSLQLDHLVLAVNDREPGARGAGKALYLFDPSKHLIEIRHYEAS